MDARPIGLFDSGFGGVNVLASAVTLLPQEDFLFLGDNLHAPYGDRTPEEVLAFTREGVNMLLAQGCKAIVIACNTATSVAADALRKGSALPIIGMEPALKPAALLPQEGAVLVMATAMTLKLGKFQALMAQYGQHAVPVPCPGLVELIEAGETDGPRIRAKLAEYLSPWLTQPVKAVVLGCTHYVFLRRALRAYLPAEVALVDGNLGTARQLQTVLDARDLRKPKDAPARGEVSFISTSPDPAIPLRMRAWFDLALAELGAGCNS